MVVESSDDVVTVVFSSDERRGLGSDEELEERLREILEGVATARSV